MCLKITVTNKAQKICHSSLPALYSSCQSRSSILGQNGWLCYLNTHPNFKGETSYEKLSKQAWAEDRGCILRCSREHLHPSSSLQFFPLHHIWASWLWYLILLLEAKVTCQRSPGNFLHAFISAFIVFLSVFSLHCCLPLLSIQFFSLMYRTFP